MTAWRERRIESDWDLGLVSKLRSKGSKDKRVDSLDAWARVYRLAAWDAAGEGVRCGVGTRSFGASCRTGIEVSKGAAAASAMCFSGTVGGGDLFHHSVPVVPRLAFDCGVVLEDWSHQVGEEAPAVLGGVATAAAL